MTENFQIKSYTPKELRDLYNVSKKTWSSWLSKISSHIGPLEGKTYKPIQVKKIIEHLGEPGQ